MCIRDSCGAGGAQMFKEPEKGNVDINVERTEEALEEKPNIIATGCPFCMTMMTCLLYTSRCV